MTFDRDSAERALEEWFAPWVKELDLVVETCEPGFVRARQPYSAKFSRSIGGLSGQAIMAAIDTVMVLAVQSTLAEQKAITTVSQTTNFLREIGEDDVIYEVEVVKAGRTMAFGNARVFEADSADRICATATVTYAILGRRIPEDGGGSVISR